MSKMANNIVPQGQKFSVAITTPKFQNMIKSSLRDPHKVERFTGAILSAVAVNEELAKCDPWSILTGALTGEMLGLSPSPQMGQYYLIPRGGKATFQLSARGVIQLALRSGQYRKLNAIEIKEGELVSWNPLTEEIVLDIIQDPVQREAAPTMGYVAYFEYTNGYSKTIYWSREKVEAHAKRYSAEYRSKGANSTFWGKNFDQMAIKTVLMQLIKRWGTMTVDSPIVRAMEAEEYEEPVDAVDAPVNGSVGAVNDAVPVQDADVMVVNNVPMAATASTTVSAPAQDAEQLAFDDGLADDVF